MMRMILMVGLLAMAAPAVAQTRRIVAPEPQATTIDVVVRSSPDPTLATFEARYFAAPYAKPGETGYPQHVYFWVTACNPDACSAPKAFFPAKGNRIRLRVKAGLLYRVEANVMGSTGFVDYQR